MSPATPSSHETDKSKDNLYSTSILITNLLSPSDYHVLESAIRNATRSTKDRLTVILHSPAFANQEEPQANWFEIQRLLTWTYVESTAVAQDMDKVLLDTDVLLRPPHMQGAEGTAEDEELVKEADAVYVFEDGTLRFLPDPYLIDPTLRDHRLGYIFMVDFKVLQLHSLLQTHNLGRVTYPPPASRGYGQALPTHCRTGRDI